MPKVIVRGKEGQNEVVFRLREDGRTVFKKIPFLNYFYIRTEDFSAISIKARNLISRSEELVDSFGNNFTKLILTNNFHRNLLKNAIEDDGIETFESDVNSVTRFMTTNDLQWQDMTQLKIACLDIETDDRLPLTSNTYGEVEAKGCVLSMAIGPQYGDEDSIKYFYNKDPEHIEGERELLKEMFNEIKEYDVITAWNGDKFDTPYIRQRQEFCGLADYFDWDFMNCMDDKVIFKSFYDRKYKSYSLSAVSQQFIGKDKVKFADEIPEVLNPALFESYNKNDPRVSMRQGKIWWLFHNKSELFKRYNINDVRLMQMIEQKAKNWAPKFIVALKAQSFLHETKFNSVIADNLYLRKCFLHNIIVPRKPTKDEQEQRKLAIRPGGGYTFAFETGLHVKQEAFDFKSHYPLIIISFNISPEMYVDKMAPDEEELAEFLTPEELQTLKDILPIKSAHLSKKGALKSSYAKAIDAYMKGKPFTLLELMFKICDKYEGKKALAFAKEKGFVVTPADFNNDTTGWTFHPHRFFRSTIGMFPLIEDELLTERDKIKYEIQRKKKADVRFIDTEEHSSLHFYQTGIKILGNSMFGVLGAVHTRFYLYEAVDTITTVGRWLLKKSILHTKANGFKVVAGDTDSIFLLTTFETEEQRLANIDMLNKGFYHLYKNLYKNFNTIHKGKMKNPETKVEEDSNYWCVFEHEHTFPAMITVAKKRYYYIEEEHDKDGNVKQWVETRGGAFLKNDTNPLAAKLQKELCTDILRGAFNKQEWHDRLVEIKNKCLTQTLEKQYLVFSKKYVKHFSEFGQQMVDKETNQLKLDKDGKPRMAPIPVHIRLVMRQMVEGKKQYEVGDTIEYIIEKPIVTKTIKTYKNGKTKEILTKPSKQSGITPEEYSEGSKQYDEDTYLGRIMTPVAEIIKTVYPEDLYTLFGDCWNLSKEALEKLLQELIEDDEEDVPAEH